MILPPALVSRIAWKLLVWGYYIVFIFHLEISEILKKELPAKSL